MPSYTDTLAGGCPLPSENIIEVRHLNLPDDNWYVPSEANDAHPQWGASFNLFALLDDGGQLGLRWLPVEKKQ